MVVLMPFTTAFYCKTFLINEPFIFYSVNVILLSLIKYIMVYRIQKDDLLEDKNDIIILQWLKTRDLITCIAWLLAIVISLKFVILSRFAPLLMLPFLKFVDIVYNRKHTKRRKRPNRRKRK